MEDNKEKQTKFTMPAIIIPEMIIYNFLNAFLKNIKEDLKNNDEKATILYTAFAVDECGNELNLENYKYYEQLKDIILKREVTVSLGYNLQVASQLAIHIILPGETGDHVTIGADEGYQEGFHKDEDNFYETKTRKYNTSYNLMITSENSTEVILFYHLLKVMFLSCIDQLEFMGLRDPKDSGQDVTIQTDLVPPNIFHRVLSLSFFYEVTVRDFLAKAIIKNFKITGIIKSNN